MKGILKNIVVWIITKEAKFLLKRTRPKIIAVVGSVGKTSTKDAVYSVLKESLHVRKSQKSFNSEIGIPLSVLGLENGWNNPFLWLKNIFDGAVKIVLIGDYPKVLVLEMGVDRPGDMKKLTEWIKPDVVVLTRLPDVPVHVEYFETPEAVINEKMTLVRSLKPEGVLVYNNDDERVRQEAENIRQKSFGYSRYSQSHFMISNDEVVLKNRKPVGMTFTLSHIDEAVAVEMIGSLGVQHAYSCAAAAAVGSIFGISLSQTAKAMSQYTPPQGRMRILSGIENTLLIDDTYNSSPVAALRALQTLSELNSYGQRKIAILGDMMELGKYSTREHERVGEVAAKSVNVLVTIGLRSRKTAEGALEHGLSEKNIYQYDTVEEAIVEVPRLLEDGDAVLVKASQGIRAEKLVKVLMEDKELAKKVLVRQDVMWSNI
ncbi:UDP-N-acetylmuramoyl-tripeptide--D-alanyl-D-alanine ligase [Candidatus Kaiserbacteria bacterium]|nr:UDP-N-acetylmuramoyl-tripeptide--D-alanyl-D-alanine ligase [Candidatus Kaiserbacteria bacterium]